MALSYHQAVGLFSEAVSKIGYRVVVDEITEKQACRLLREAAAKIFEKLTNENKLDVLFHYDAETLDQLVSGVIEEMNERLYSI